MTILYLTATGNSLYIAKAFGAKILSIPQMIKSDTYQFNDEKIGIIFPIYSNKVMPYIEEFLMKSKFECDYLFAVMTYGIFDAAAANHLQKIALKSNLNFSYINTIKMVDNWIPGFKMENQIKNEHKKEIEKHTTIIVSDVKKSKRWIIKTSLFDRFFTGIMVRNANKKGASNNLGGGKSGVGIKYHYTLEDSCIGCGTCAKVCPVNNITVDKEKRIISLGGYCISCFGCTHNCPTNPIRLKGERSKTRYRNSNITLNEIIKSNNG